MRYHQRFWLIRFVANKKRIFDFLFGINLNESFSICFFEAHVKDFEFVRLLTHFRFCSLTLVSGWFLLADRTKRKKKHISNKVNWRHSPLTNIVTLFFFAWSFSLCMCITITNSTRKGMEWKKNWLFTLSYANCKSLEISLLFVQKHSTKHVFRILDKFFYIFIHKIMFSVRVFVCRSECVFVCECCSLKWIRSNRFSFVTHVHVVSICVYQMNRQLYAKKIYVPIANLLFS